MKIDHDYLKGLLEAFQAAPTGNIDVFFLTDQGLVSDEEKFLFHIDILFDKELVAAAHSYRPGPCYRRSGDGSVTWDNKKMRLTAEGHVFLDSISHSAIWDLIKGKFKDASLDTMITVSKEGLKLIIKNGLNLNQ